MTRTVTCFDIGPLCSKRCVVGVLTTVQCPKSHNLDINMNPETLTAQNELPVRGFVIRPDQTEVLLYYPFLVK